MEAFIELSTQLTFITQELQMRQQAYSRHQRVASPICHMNIPLREVQYVCNPYLNTYNSGWPHHPYLSWETNKNIPQPPKAKDLKFKRVMAELANLRAQMENY